MSKKFFERLFIFGIPDPNANDGDTTLEKLKEGNKHFTSYVLNTASVSNIDRVRYLAKNGQKPLAILVTCSDARISPERIFNAEMGDFFIIRTAGNVVGDLELGSIEYALTSFGTDMILVMGHENCGAIHSAIDDHDPEHNTGNIKHIIDIIQPSIDKAKQETDNHFSIISKAEDYNIINSVSKIKSSKIIKKLISEGKVTVIGAKYGIATGDVTFFE